MTCPLLVGKINGSDWINRQISSMSKRNPIIYLRGPEVTLDYLSSMTRGVRKHFNEIIDSLPARNSEGESISLVLNIDDVKPERVKACARKFSQKTSQYEIYLSGGLVHYLLTASGFLHASHNFFPWLGSIKLVKDLRKIGRKRALSDFTFYILTYHVLLHELAHIYLGHCDFVQRELGFSHLNEFEEYGRELSLGKKRILVALEADADRQAGNWLMGFLWNAMGPNWRGVDVVFPSKSAFFEFLVCVLTVGHALNQQLTARLDPVHPSPNQRQYIAVSSIQAYLEEFHPEDAKAISPKIMRYATEAAEKLGLLGLQGPEELMGTSMSMVHVDSVLRELGIRKYLHVFERSQAGI